MSPDFTAAKLINEFRAARRAARRNNTPCPPRPTSDDPEVQAVIDQYDLNYYGDKILTDEEAAKMAQDQRADILAGG